MKKFITLLFCSTILYAAAFAQDHHRERNNEKDNYAFRDRDRDHNFNHEASRGDRDHDNYRMYYSHDRYDGYGGNTILRIRPALNVYFTYRNYRYGMDQQDAVIARISAYYDNQVQLVMNDWTLNRWEKRDAINNLEAQKAAEINNIYAQCGNAVPYPGQY